MNKLKSYQKNKEINMKAVKLNGKLSFHDKLRELEEEDENLKSSVSQPKSSLMNKSNSKQFSRSPHKNKKLENQNSTKKSKRKKSSEDTSVVSDESSEIPPKNLNISFLNKENKFCQEKGSKTKANLYEKFDSYQFTHSILQETDIEITISAPDKVQSFGLKVNTFKQALERFLFDTPFKYYEFSNVKNKTATTSSIDSINYDFLYEKTINRNLAMVNTAASKNIEVLRSIGYITAMSSLFRKYIDVISTDDTNLENTFFYLVTPLVSHYFFKYVPQQPYFMSAIREIVDSGVIVSNTNRAFEKSGIKFEKLFPNDGVISKKKNKKAPGVPLLSLPNVTSEREMENFINSTEGGAMMNILSDCPIYASSHNHVLLFNQLLNESEDKSFNIFSPFEFESATQRECKFILDPVQKRADKSYTINLKIFGCIFQQNLNKLISFLDKENANDILLIPKTINYSYTAKLFHFMKTGSFHILNKNLKTLHDKFIYQDGSYLIKK